MDENEKERKQLNKRLLLKNLKSSLKDSFAKSFTLRNILTELITFVAIVAVCYFIGRISGWKDASLHDNIIGVIIGMAIWHIAVFSVKKIKNR